MTLTTTTFYHKIHLLFRYNNHFWPLNLQQENATIHDETDMAIFVLRIHCCLDSGLAAGYISKVKAET